jgi:putative transposase
MARLPRLIIPNLPHYVSQHGNNKQDIFLDEEDYNAFRGWLKEASTRFEVAIHAYVLMPNQIRMLLTPATSDGLARFMQWIGRHYVPYFNQKYGRSGTLWEGRYRTSVVEAPLYVLLCAHYIERAPVETGVAATMQSHAWTSYLHHIGECGDPLLRTHASYWGLGNTPFEREMQYRKRSEAAFASEEMAAVDAVLKKGGVLGTLAFKEQLEKQAGRKLGGGKRGRPPKKAV